MATVHPSRLGLVPQSSSSFRAEDKYSSNVRDRDADYRRSSRRDDSLGRDDRNNGGIDGRRRGRSPDTHNDKAKSRDDAYERPRRRSPDYSAYRREEPPHSSAAKTDRDGRTGAAGTGESSAPWRVPGPGNMYSSRGRGGFQGTGGEDYFASRRMERENKIVNIWPPSPKEPSLDVNESKKKKSSKRRRASSISSSSEDERERERRRRKEKKRKEKARDKDHRKDKDRHNHRREKSYDDDSDDDRRQRKRRGRSHRSDEISEDGRWSRTRTRSRSETRNEKERHKSRHGSRANSPPRSHAEAEEEWVEKPADSFVAIVEHSGKEPHTESTAKRVQENDADDSDSDEVGPKPPPRVTNTGKKVDERQYGGALLRGEGSAMAAFLQDGNTDARIPRRGEIGLTSDEIATFESVGYVMSGSRHRRMNAVRMRKENQVISAEEKRGILKLQKEERERREAILRDEFRELVEDKLKVTGTGGAVPSTSAGIGDEED